MGADARRLESRRGLAWELIELHYGSRHAFTGVRRGYEATVARLVEERGTPREELRLNPAETRDLFNSEALRDLIVRWVEPLRESAHSFFREANVSEPYDTKVSRIYHELSILLEEHLSVLNFPRGGSAREFARLFREVSEYYPVRLRRVRDLFARAERRLQEILPEFSDDGIVLRSAFLFREHLWPDATRASLLRFLGHMFPKGGAGEGFLAIAQSFFKAGFFEQAAECARTGVAALSRQAQARSGHAQQLRDTIRELDRLVARAKSEQEALIEASQESP
ncbi:MAG: hypothetical protein ACYTGZ_12775 [Planctomycetota bacterium]|jgi:hypothetical protein